MIDRFADWIFDTRIGNVIGLILVIPVGAGLIVASIVAGRSILDVMDDYQIRKAYESREGAR